MHEMRIQFSELLADIGFVATTHAASLRREFRTGRSGGHAGRAAEPAEPAEAAADANDGNLELIRAIICAALYPNARPSPACLLEHPPCMPSACLALAPRPCPGPSASPVTGVIPRDRLRSAGRAHRVVPFQHDR